MYVSYGMWWIMLNTLFPKNTKPREPAGSLLRSWEATELTTENLFFEEESTFPATGTLKRKKCPYKPLWLTKKRVRKNLCCYIPISLPSTLFFGTEVKFTVCLNASSRNRFPYLPSARLGLLPMQVSTLMARENFLCTASQGQMPLVAPTRVSNQRFPSSHCCSIWIQLGGTQLASREISVHNLGSTTLYWGFQLSRTRHYSVKFSSDIILAAWSVASNQPSSYILSTKHWFFFFSKT